MKLKLATRGCDWLVKAHPYIILSISLDLSMKCTNILFFRIKLLNLNLIDLLSLSLLKSVRSSISVTIILYNYLVNKMWKVCTV